MVTTPSKESNQGLRHAYLVHIYAFGLGSSNVNIYNVIPDTLVGEWFLLKFGFLEPHVGSAVLGKKFSRSCLGFVARRWWPPFPHDIPQNFFLAQQASFIVSFPLCCRMKRGGYISREWCPISQGPCFPTGIFRFFQAPFSPRCHFFVQSA